MLCLSVSWGVQLIIYNNHNPNNSREVMSPSSLRARYSTTDPSVSAAFHNCAWEQWNTSKLRAETSNSLVSLKRKESWYSFKYWEDLASSRNREYARLMSSTWTSVPWRRRNTRTINTGAPISFLNKLIYQWNTFWRPNLDSELTLRLRHTTPAVLIRWMA